MHKLKSLFPQSIKNIYHLTQAVLANIIYGFPSKKIKVIGVTGTNGKTTTVQMVARIFEDAGKKVAVASTINFKIGEREWINKTKYTTLSPFAVQKFIKQAAEANCGYLVLETSSHSLDQYRVWGVEYSTAVITNVTREHLDYHKDMRRYREAKKRLFKMVSKANGNLIVNLDMENPEEFLNFEKGRKIGYAVENPNMAEGIETIRAEKTDLGKYETRFEVGGVGFMLHIPGQYNVENALAATSVALLEGISLEACSSALEKIKGVMGRMERVPSNKGFDIIIDYAVTPDSLKKLYFIIENMRKTKESKIISVLGSCGERDRGKRPIMGEIVSKVADCVILTNEDPYFEDPWQIIDEVAAGVENKTEGENFFKIMDRREAIAKALSVAKEGDIVVVTGKGAEENMMIKDEKIPWNDKQVILEELEKI